MRKKISIIVSLVIITMLLLTGLSVASYKEFNYYDPSPVDPDDTPQLEVHKQVWNGTHWVDELSVSLGTIVRFRITAIYHDTPGNSCFEIGEIRIADLLTDFEYIGNQWISLAGIDPENYDQYYPSNHTLFWNFMDQITLGNSQHVYLEFDAKANKTGQLVNIVSVMGLEHCCCDFTSDDAYCYINVGEVPTGMLSCEKLVYDPSTHQWVDQINAFVGGPHVRFKITFTYTGNYELTNIKVKDILPSCLQYENNANPVQTAQSGNVIFWNLSDTLSNGESFSIEFDTEVISPGTNINTAIITGFIEPGTPLYCDDTATVIAEEPDGDIICQKQVWNSTIQQWVEQIYADIGETIRFRITLTYNGEGEFMNIEVKDILPACLQYANSANPVQTGQSGNIIYWNLSSFFYLSDGESVSIEFNALVISSGTNINTANITGTINCHLRRYCQDIATVIVDQPIPQGDLICQKQVWDTTTQSWVDQVYAFVGETVPFRITLTYIGNFELENIKVKDILPACLQYANSANPVQTGQSGKFIYWNLSDTLTNGESLIILFSTQVISTGTNINTANITSLIDGGIPLYCQDTATIIAREPSQGNLTCQKQVWDPSTQQWVEQITTDNSNTVRFKITLAYQGSGTLVGIRVKDILPPCLQYADNASPVQTSQSGNILFWNLSSTLSNSQSLSIQFDAKVISNGTNLNTANITALEHCIDPLYCEDTATVIVREPQEEGDLICEKQIWNSSTQQWVEQINADISDTVRFKITITYTGNYELKNITVKDTLPVCLQYADNATFLHTGQSGNIIYWNISHNLSNGQNISIEFDALVISNGTNVNTVNITGLINGQIPLYCEDTATVVVRVLPPPDLRCDKKVWDPATQKWVDQINAKIGDIVRFRINLSYWGSLSFYNFWINDTLPVCLQYNNNATPYQPTAVNGKKVTWYLAHFIKYGQNISLEFDALVISNGTNINRVNITGWECGIRRISCDDTATVIVEEEPNLLCEMKVWDSTTKKWVEQINAKIGDIVRFKITISYIGSLSFYNIWVNDTLPVCLQYNNNATPHQPIVVEGKQVKWYLLLAIQFGQSISLEFNALVISSGTNINIVNITGVECGIRHLFCQETATVIVENEPEPLVAEAGGPYTGYSSELIPFTGSATGGVPPYTYQWDLDNDGTYDDGVGANKTIVLSIAGTYTISIKVYDSLGKNDTDIAQVIINNHNTAPNDPNTPDGPESGKTKVELKYSSSAIDPDGDHIFLLFDWDDGSTSGWLGPFASGTTQEATHTWAVRGNYNIKVKAKDANGAESLWSDPQTISIKMNIFGTIFEKIIERFPALEHLIAVLLNILERINLVNSSIQCIPMS